MRPGMEADTAFFEGGLHEAELLAISSEANEHPPPLPGEWRRQFRNYRRRFPISFLLAFGSPMLSCLVSVGRREGGFRISG